MIHRVHSQATCADEEKLAIGCKAINYLVHKNVALGSLIWVQFLAANMVIKTQRRRRKENHFLFWDKYRTIFFAIQFHASYLPHFHVKSK